MMSEKTHISVPALMGIYLALLILLALTLVAAHFPLGALSLLISLAIAAVKALLVVLFFMHLKYQSRTVWIFAAAGIVWLAILFSLTFTDYLTRPALSRSDPLASTHQVSPP